MLASSALNLTRIPLGLTLKIAPVSPFSKLHYVSHTVGDHTSILAFIERRFLTFPSGQDSQGGDFIRLHLTKRDQYASPLEELFDFDNSPSLNTPISPVPGPALDCTP